MIKSGTCSLFTSNGSITESSEKDTEGKNAKSKALKGLVKVKYDKDVKKTMN